MRCALMYECRNSRTNLGEASLLTLFIFLCFIPNGFCQTYSFNHYSVSTGLPSPEVYDIQQDRSGFIWFTTDNGVVKYDGQKMETIRVSDGLTDPVVFGASEDSFDRIWFRTFSGQLSYYHKGKVYPYKYNDKLSGLLVNDFLHNLRIDSLGNLWLGSNFFIAKISARGEMLEKHHIRSGDVAIRHIGNDYVIGRNGSTTFLKRMKINDKTYELPRKDIFNEHPIIRQVKWKGKQYFSLGSEIFDFNDDRVILAAKMQDQILSMYVDHSERLWIGYQRKGTECFESFTQKSAIHFPFLNGKSVTSILEDSQGGYWASTLQDGVYHVPEVSLTTKNIFFSDRTRAANSSGSHTLVGDDAGFVTLLDKGGNVKLKIDLKSGPVRRIFSTSKGDFLVTLPVVSYLFDSVCNKQRKISVGLNSFFEDKDGMIWGIGGNKIVRIDSAGRDEIYLVSDKVYRSFFKIGERLILGTRLGFDVFTHDFRFVSSPPAFRSLKISDMTSLNDSTLLIATIGTGFFIVNVKDWSYNEYNAKNKFTASNIYSFLLVDSKIWFGTENGIAITDISSLLKGSPTFSFYNNHHGLINNRISRLINQKPDMWAFYDEGFTILPQEIKKPQAGPRFYLKEVRIKNQVIPIDSISELATDFNNIQFDFGFIDFTNQNILARYRLSPKENWSYTEDRSIKFASLSPGDYSFELEYSTDNFNWKPGVHKEFFISPPWWLDWRFLAVALLIFSALITIYFKRRISLIKERESFSRTINEYRQKLINIEIETQERDRARIARDLHDSIGCNLAAIKLSIAGLFKQHNDPIVQQIESELQISIQEIRNIIRGMMPEGLDTSGLVELICAYVDRIKINLNVAINIQSEGEQINEQLINLSSFRIIQELISNSLKYSKAKMISIRVIYSPKSLTLIYEDDGVGFDINTVERGFGISTIQTRVDAMSAQLTFQSGSFGVYYKIEIPITQINFESVQRII